MVCATIVQQLCKKAGQVMKFSLQAIHYIHNGVHYIRNGWCGVTCIHTHGTPQVAHLIACRLTTVEQIGHQNGNLMLYKSENVFD